MAICPIGALAWEYIIEPPYDKTHVATDGSGVWLAAWSSIEDVDGTVGTDDDLFLTRSTDGGVSWTTPTVLNTNAATDSGNDGCCSLLPVDGGVWFAKWFSTDALQGSIVGDGNIFFSRSTDGGLSWAAPAPMNSTAYSESDLDAFAQTSADGAGNMMTVWMTLDPTLGNDSEDIVFSRSVDNGVSWSSATLLYADSGPEIGAGIDPALATSATTWLALWTSVAVDGVGTDTNGHVLASRSYDHGATWTTSTVRSTPPDIGFTSINDHQVVCDGENSWVRIWEEGDPQNGVFGADSDIFASRSTDDGATWTLPTLVNTDGASDDFTDLYPHVAYGSSSTLMVAWGSTYIPPTGAAYSETNIKVSRSTDAGATWSSSTTISTTPTLGVAEGEAPSLATDGAGNWVCFWVSKRVYSEAYEDGGFEEWVWWEVVSSRSTDDGITWTTPAIIVTSE